MKKFGVRILEGYGATETSPVLCINIPTNVKAGTVGRLLPHITYKIRPVAGVETGGTIMGPIAKIAGEMVSLTSVEQALDKLYNGAV